jgi:hypothetical protein
LDFALEVRRCQEHTGADLAMGISDKIFGDKLTTFELAPDGSRFCMSVADETGQSRGLGLPSECLVQLIMTLPEMASQALRMRYRDDSLRIVYPLGAMRVEAAHIDETTILTLATHDGFAVSFGLTAHDLKRLENTARDARTKMRPSFIKN